MGRQRKSLIRYPSWAQSTEIEAAVCTIARQFASRNSCPNIYAADSLVCLKKANNSALISSFRVEHMPCGAPGITFSVAPLRSCTERIAESAIGTIWSSSPWRTRVGTSIFFRSSVKSVSENALMQSYPALSPHMLCSQNESRKPCETLLPGRLAPPALLSHFVIHYSRRNANHARIAPLPGKRRASPLPIRSR